MSKVQNLLKNKSWRRTRVTGGSEAESKKCEKKKKWFVSGVAVNRMPTLTYSAAFLGQFCSISFQITITFHSRVKCKCQHIFRKTFSLSRRRKKVFQQAPTEKKVQLLTDRTSWMSVGIRFRARNWSLNTYLIDDCGEETFSCAKSFKKRDEGGRAWVTSCGNVMDRVGLWHEEHCGMLINSGDMRNIHSAMMFAPLSANSGRHS